MAEGLRAGDIVVDIRKQPVGEPADILKAVQATTVGGELPIEIIREGRPLALSPHL